MPTRKCPARLPRFQSVQKVVLLFCLAEVATKLSLERFLGHDMKPGPFGSLCLANET